MKHLLTLLLVFTCALAKAQGVTLTPKKLRPISSGNVTIRDSLGFLKRTDANGNETYFKLPLLSVVGANDTLAAHNQRLSAARNLANSKVPYHSVASLRASATGSSEAPPAITLYDPNRGGIFYLDTDDNVTADNGSTCIRTGTNLCYKRSLDNGVNVKWFGATGNGTTNDLPSCQAAVDFAKVARAFLGTGAQVRLNVMFPQGAYRFNSATGGLNITGASGIWLVGGSGNYQTTQITGNCTGAIFDFTGSQMSGCQGFSFFSHQGEAWPAKIGVLFAYAQTGNGLNCGIKDCYFEMQSNITYNGGFGTVGICSIRSEEFYISGCNVRASTGILLANNKNVASRSASFTFESGYNPINSGGNGSEGVIDIVATSVHNLDKLGHALMLQGVNGLRFHGYMHGGYSAVNLGTEIAAIGCYQPCSALNISGTIEGFSTIIYDHTGSPIVNSNFRLSYANIVDITQPIIYLSSGTAWDNSDVFLSMGNAQAEIGSRYFLYTPPVDGGNSPTTTRIVGSRFSCSNWVNNPTFISGSLLKQCLGRVEFNTDRPFSVDNHWVSQGWQYVTPVGNVGFNGPVDIQHFSLADKATTSSGNAGVYKVKIRGVVKPVSYTLSEALAVDFETNILIYQRADGSRIVGPTTTLFYSKIASNPAYFDISAITADCFFGGEISLRLIVTSSGSATSQALQFNGTVSVLTDFAVNASHIRP